MSVRIPEEKIEEYKEILLNNYNQFKIKTEFHHYTLAKLIIVPEFKKEDVFKGIEKVILIPDGNESKDKVIEHLIDIISRAYENNFVAEEHGSDLSDDSKLKFQLTRQTEKDQSELIDIIQDLQNNAMV